VVVAVDGPAGVGKSTVARGVATALKVPYLDTGAFYRALTLAVIRSGVDPTDAAAVLSVARSVALDFSDGTMWSNGEDVTEAIRAPEVSALVSAVSAFPEVRRVIVARQQAWVARHGDAAVVEGRDIGTVVFPEAPVKVYLVADPSERARRRATDAEVAGQEVSAVEGQLRARDRADSTRRASPLRPAEDAVIIDTTLLAADQVVALVLGLVAEAGA
jgi:cytidylate kinase